MEEVEDTKPDVDINIKEEEDTQPEPDESLMLDSGCGRVWSVKVPKHLMERWSSISKDNIHLGSVRIYDRDPKTGKQRIVLLVPSMPLSPDDPKASEKPSYAPGTYDEYELDMVNDSVENQVVVAEREKTPGSRARTTILTGRVKHDCNLRPVLTDSYRRRIKERSVAANKPKRSIKILDEEEAGGIGRMNMLNGGVGTPYGGFQNLVKGKSKIPKGTFERYARIPRNQLLDMLFGLYRERPRWSARDLRARTEQPEAYLKEVLNEIADLHRSGEFNGTYELKANFKDMTSGDVEYPGTGLVKKEEGEGEGNDDVDDNDDDEDSDEDTDDSDMEEVS